MKRKDFYGCIYTILITGMIILVVGSIITLIPGIVYSVVYSENMSCENNNWESCWETCKCFWCDGVNKCLDRDYINKCSSTKTINDQCEKDPENMIIAWSIFGAVLFAILMASFICICTCLCDTNCCKNKNAYEINSDDEIDWNTWKQYLNCYPKAEIIMATQ